MFYREDVRQYARAIRRSIEGDIPASNAVGVPSED